MTEDEALECLAATDKIAGGVPLVESDRDVAFDVLRTALQELQVLRAMRDYERDHTPPVP